MRLLPGRPEPLSDPPVGLAELRAWYAGEAQRTVATAAMGLAEDVLPNLFGYHLLQIGTPFEQERALCELSRISHRVVLETEPALATEGNIVVRPDALPVLANSVDVVVLPHTLEFCANPRGILREVERVLVGEGRVLVLGFNPWSLMGLGHLALAWRGEAPWAGHFLSAGRICDWLSVLGFVVERVSHGAFLPPLRAPRWRSRLRPVEQLGVHFLPKLGNLYGILACKRVLVARPARLVLKRERSRVPVRAVETSRRVVRQDVDTLPKSEAP